MAIIIPIIFVLAIVALVVVAKKSGNRNQPQLAGDGPAGLLEDKRAEVNVTNLRLGDIVSYFGTDFVVEGRIDYTSGGWPWTCFMLSDGDEVRWLSIEEDDRLEVGLWQEIDLEFDGAPQTLEYEGETFKLAEKGVADVSQTGRTGRRTGMKCEYFEYTGSGERSLSVEKWGMEVEVSIGQDLNPYSLEILPGGGTSFG